MIQQCYPGIYQYTLENQDDAGVNSIQIHVIPGKRGQRSLMIDSGFGQEHCFAETEAVLKELQIPFECLDVFITHEHNDHSGLAHALEQKGARILMNPDEERHSYECLYHRISYLAMEEKVGVLRKVGVTPELVPGLWNCYAKETEDEAQTVGKPGQYPDNKIHGVVQAFSYQAVYPGQVLRYGDFVLHVMSLRGHSHGQLGLYDEEHQILFPADQVLKRIAPIVSTSRPDEHLLEAYMRSLTEIKSCFSGWTAFPAHGGKITEIHAEVERIAGSYLDKLGHVRQAVEKAGKPLTAYETACLVYGIRRIPESIREFFLVKSMISKTFSCLEYLYEQGHLKRESRDEILYWSRM